MNFTLAVGIFAVFVLTTAAQQLETKEQVRVEEVEEPNLIVTDDIEAIPKPIPFLPRPKNPETCCHPGSTYVDLVNGEVCDHYNKAVQVIAGPSAQSSSIKCSMQAVLRVRARQFNFIVEDIIQSHTCNYNIANDFMLPLLDYCLNFVIYPTNSPFVTMLNSKFILFVGLNLNPSYFHSIAWAKPDTTPSTVLFITGRQLCKFEWVT